jgi:hypothetical protein
MNDFVSYGAVEGCTVGFQGPGYFLNPQRQDGSCFVVVAHGVCCDVELMKAVQQPEEAIASC